MRIIFSAVLTAVTCLGQKTVPLRPKPVTIQSAVHFGDSISFGWGASNPSTKGWVADLAALRAWICTNYAVGSEMAADQATFVMGHAVADNGTAAFYALGRNDASTYGLDAAKMADFSTITLADLAWLSIPESKKATGKNGQIQYAGRGWGPSPYWATDDNGAPQMLGKLSCEKGDTATAVISGSSVGYVELTMVQGGSGKITVVVDGVTRTAEYNAYPANPDSLTTYNERSHRTAPQVIRMTGLNPMIPHQIEAVVSAGCAAVHWIAGNGVANAPLVFAVGVASAGSDNAEAAATLNAEITAYNGLIASTVATLARDGLNVHFIDVRRDLAWPADYCNPGFCDGTHPNDSGHQRLADMVNFSIRPWVNSASTQSAR